MARYPGAIWKPITASKGRDPLTQYNRVNLHSTAADALSYNYFNQSGIPDSHFEVAYDGTVYQYVDTSMQAFADLEGNDATVSIETMGVTEDTGDEPWRPAQVVSIVKLVVWIMRTHHIKVQLATNSWAGSDTSRGLSWHRLGCNGNFPELPSIQAGRNQRGGGMYYTTKLGKVCPGYDRIAQIHSTVWPQVRTLLLEGDAMGLDNADKTWLREMFRAEIERALSTTQIATPEELVPALGATASRDGFLRAGAWRTESIKTTLSNVSNKVNDVHSGVAPLVDSPWSDDPAQRITTRTVQSNSLNRLDRIEKAVNDLGAEEPPAPA